MGKNVLSMTAFGYNLSDKVNSIINKDKGILLDHRTKTFLKTKNISHSYNPSLRFAKKYLSNKKAEKNVPLE